MWLGGDEAETAGSCVRTTNAAICVESPSYSVSALSARDAAREGKTVKRLSSVRWQRIGMLCARAAGW